MPAVIALFLRLLGASLVPLGWRLLRGLGFAAFTFTGIQLMMDQAKDYVFQQLLSLPSEWVQMIGLLKLDVCFNILFSAYVARAVLWGMNQATGSKSGVRWGGGA
jgi:hypothetical protein